MGWSRDQAIEYFLANSSKPLHDITVEIDRYITWPGQALSYKLGELKFKGLRVDARETLGDSFDIREPVHQRVDRRPTSLFHHLRTLVRVLLPAAALSAVACGGQMPFSGNINVAGDPPPIAAPPPPKEEPKPPARVEVRDNKIEIREKIQFELAKAAIKSESHDLLNEIVQVIKDNPHIKKIAIEGHASSDGNDDFNMKLSDDRAKSVRAYLVEHGIGEGVLSAKGFGETKPIADNETEEGRVKNRRVEFYIVEQDVTKKKVAIDPKTGKETVVEKTKVPAK
jgi:OOP family OmpA-OmpF porin